MINYHWFFRGYKGERTDSWYEGDLLDVFNLGGEEMSINVRKD